MTPARAFARSAPGYEAAAAVQRTAATRLAARIATLGLPATPRVLEIGAGTGLLTRALAAHFPHADLLVTDPAPQMLAEAKRRIPGPARFAAMRAESPAVEDRFDLVCSNFAAQWFADPPATLAKLATLVVPGGWLAVTTLVQGTLESWHAALEAEGRATHGLRYPNATTLIENLDGAHVETATILLPHASALAFLRDLKTLGATGGTPPARGDLRRVLARFDAAGAVAEFRTATILWRRPSAGGLFVTGTDTGIGKTIVAASLAHRTAADYWKPVQTGTADGDDDTATVAALTGARTHPPAHRLAAPLSPEAAGVLENTVVTLDDFILPATDRPIIVEGAGGVLVPLGGGATMADLMAKLGLPAVLVARSTLGTINHTLLSLAALRDRRIPIRGVVLVGPPNPGNRDAIARHGRTKILAEFPLLDRIDTCAIAALGAMFSPAVADDFTQ